MITYEEVLNRMLARVPNSIDKREGSLIYTAIAPVATEYVQMLIEQENNQKEAYADTASREYLIKRAKERGIKPYPSTKAVVKAEIAPSGLNIESGSRFSLEDVVYVAIGNIDASHIRLECEAPGTIGNKSTGDLIPVEYVDRLQSVAIVELPIPAEDEEETEDFRKRYFDSFGSQAFGGNIQDYKEKTKSISGVSGVKVTPTWQGAGTVKLTIISSDYDVPSTELVSQVKEIIDPNENTGKGYGLAPIGHVVTVEGITSQAINIQTTITYQSGWNYEACKTYIEKAIDDYYKELAKNWENESELIVRISQIETRLLNAQGVLDIQNTSLNGQTNNLTLGEMQIPKRGAFNG